jgi:hypothetical protein
VIHTDTRYLVSLPEDISQRPSEVKDIPFPCIRKWRINSINDLYALLDLSNADNISLYCVNHPRKFFFTPIPSQLTTLKLSNFVVTSESLPGTQRYSLPCLTSLGLSSVLFHGPMRRYFHCPKLSCLSYDILDHIWVPDTIVEDIKDPFGAPIQETFDEAFFQETPVLGSIYFAGTRLGDAVVPILASCPLLHTLDIDDCPIERFIQPFINELQDPKYLPALRVLCVDDSWPTQCNLSFEEFVVQCCSKRRDIYVFGNGEGINTKAYPDGD